MSLGSKAMSSVVDAVAKYAQEATLYIVSALIISVLVAIAVLKVRYN